MNSNGKHKTINAGETGPEERHALIVGITGIQGNTLASRLASNGWKVSGLARQPKIDLPSVTPIAADLTDASALRRALKDVHPTHVFFTTWSRRATETENCLVNGAMLENLLHALEQTSQLQHVSLVTGLKHYLGPFEAYALTKPDTPFREDQARVPYENFYYTQEDILFAEAERLGFTWNVHRPHTVIGWAIGNAMNMGLTLAVYAAICRETGRPFVFPGSVEQYNAATDVTDSRILAHQLEWAVLTPAAANQAFNVVNGDIFRWRRMWPIIAENLGLDPAPYPGKPTPLVEQMKDAEPIWDRIVAKHGLHPHPIEKLASWWHSDADLGRQIEAFTDVSKSRRLGFTAYQETKNSFRDLFDRLRKERIIPPSQS